MAYYQEIVEFGVQVKAERMKQKYSPAGLARRLLIPVEQLYAIEQGANPEVSLLQALKICRQLRVPIDALVKPRSYQSSEYRH